MEEKDVKTLEEAGLTHAQAKTYITLLEVGQTKIGTIIEKSKLQSSVVHNNINKLIDEGLVNFIMVGKVKHYKVADPKVFLNYLDRKKEEIDKQKKAISDILPRLELLKEESKKKTEVEVYKGFKGFKTAYIEEYEKMKEGEETQFIALPNPYQEDEKLHEVWIHTDEISARKNLKILGIGMPYLKKIWEKKYGHKKFYKFKYLNEEFPWDISVFKETVTIGLWSEDPIIIKIKNKDFRDRAYKYFQDKWIKSKE